MNQLMNWINPTRPLGFFVLTALLLLAIWLILRGPRIVAMLIAKYLRKRRIAWVSLVAVMLCTTMVLVVISVMGGWLRMFRFSFHGLSGDIQIRSFGLSGFSHYRQMIDRIEALPEVGKGNAVPVILTFGLLTFDTNSMDKVQVLGYPIDKIGAVNDFPDSLFRQGESSRKWAADELARLKNTPSSTEPALVDVDYLEYLQLKSVQPSRPASFSLLNEAFTPLQKLPDGVKFPATQPAPTQPSPSASPFDAMPAVRYDADQHLLITQGMIGRDAMSRLLSLSADPPYQKAMHDLVLMSRYDIIPYQFILPKSSKKMKINAADWPGMIPGSVLLGFHRDKEGHVPGRGPALYEHFAKLTVLGIRSGARSIDLGEKSERNYWIVDDSHTHIYAYDSTSVYVPFDVLQHDLNMDATPPSGDDPGSPARTSEVFVKVQPGRDLNATRDKIEGIVNQVLAEQAEEPNTHPLSVQTWEESQKTYLSAIENEKLLISILFGLISLVAVFLIFCIFYMIVQEKTKDIGIVKSVGATAGQIAGIFLGYGLVIGMVGAAFGFLFAYLLVHNINEIHTWLGHRLGVVIWNPEVYQFDTIPNTMNPPEVAVILVIAVVSAVIGALLPAIRAARLHPVEALRWE